ncbi:MAG: hypothetical protein GY861_24560 [bacterium]|nr:hypothetical protein [bacterium]
MATQYFLKNYFLPNYWLSYPTFIGVILTEIPLVYLNDFGILVETDLKDYLVEV